MFILILGQICFCVQKKVVITKHFVLTPHPALLLFLFCLLSVYANTKDYRILKRFPDLREKNEDNKNNDKAKGSWETYNMKIEDDARNCFQVNCTKRSIIGQK